jgi:hypothetical protein
MAWQGPLPLDACLLQQLGTKDALGLVMFGQAGLRACRAPALVAKASQGASMMQPMVMGAWHMAP